jgi:hypothetical protein
MELASYTLLPRAVPLRDLAAAATPIPAWHPRFHLSERDAKVLRNIDRTHERVSQIFSSNASAARMHHVAICRGGWRWQPY